MTYGYVSLVSIYFFIQKDVKQHPAYNQCIEKQMLITFYNFVLDRGNIDNNVIAKFYIVNQLHSVQCKMISELSD